MEKFDIPAKSKSEEEHEKQLKSIMLLNKRNHIERRYNRNQILTKLITGWGVVKNVYVDVLKRT